jgi:RHS repeat-associated protein
MTHGPERTINRYYDPTTGQFVSVDPMVNETGQPYAYAVDDPVNQTDPTGDGGYGAYFDEQAATANADFCHAHSNYCQFGDPSDSTMRIVAGISLGIIALATGGAGLIAVSEVGVGTLSTTSATYTGSWATATDIDGSTALEALTCASSSSCVASDGTRIVSSVSCPSTTFCAAVDSSGYAVNYALVVVPASVSQLTWNTNGSLALVLGDSSYYYLYGPGSSPVEQINLATSIPTYLTYSPSNSTWLTTNEAGDETAFYGYDAFGNLAFGTPSSAFGYAGQYTDATSGFSNLRARFYDAQTGSFTSQDPAFASTDTAYTYSGDDPVNGADPMGLDYTENLPEISGAYEAAALADPSAFDYGTFNDFSTAAVNFLNAIVTSPLRAARGAYQTYGALFRAGEDECSWSSVAPLIFMAGLDDAAALGPIDPEADALDVADAAGGEGGALKVIYRGGSQTDLQLTDNGSGVSFRDSLSNPIGERPVLRPGEKYFGIDTSQLPPESIDYDNVPPGHVSVYGLTPQQIRDAVIEEGRFQR